MDWTMTTHPLRSMVPWPWMSAIRRTGGLQDHPYRAEGNPDGQQAQAQRTTDMEVLFEAGMPLLKPGISSVEGGL